MVDVEKKVIVEPAGKSEGDWSAAPRSSTELPEFVEGEYDHLIDVAEAPVVAEEDGAEAEAQAAGGRAGEAPGDAAPDGSGPDPEGDELGQLNAHMQVLLDAGGESRDSRVGGWIRERMPRIPRS